jgi:hypothetical protein
VDLRRERPDPSLANTEIGADSDIATELGLPPDLIAFTAAGTVAEELGEVDEIKTSSRVQVEVPPTSKGELQRRHQVRATGTHLGAATLDIAVVAEESQLPAHQQRAAPEIGHVPMPFSREVPASRLKASPVRGLQITEAAPVVDTDREREPARGQRRGLLRCERGSW